ncbi:MAG TPA: type IV toxin-antitoxin system AbiEi family antitoxin domain-containing protein [Pseudonocardiaceae bacterium]
MPADRRDLRRRLFAVAAEQGGYFTAAQAKEVGYSYQAQAHHVGAGNWHRVERGLLRLTEWVPQEHDDLARWTLWSHGQGVVSHETALAVHGIGEFESARVCMTVPPNFTARDRAVRLHHGDLPPDDIQARAGFRVTTPLRSLVDIAATADEDQLARAITEAAERGLLAIRRLLARAEVVDARAALRIERALNRSDA